MVSIYRQFIHWAIPGRSDKLKPFWLSIDSRDEPFLRKKLCNVLLTLHRPSEEYRDSVIRALDIPHSLVVPFFGSFLRDLRVVLTQMPSLVVLASEQTLAQFNVDTSIRRASAIGLTTPANQTDNGVGGGGGGNGSSATTNLGPSGMPVKDQIDGTRKAESISDINGEDNYV